ncbi:hypothetical protein Desaci_2728 [Desulfosporosinus acidiphilus SJ4]|uniref:Uncharacterized protein n=1 Tax=Desulfosporosinus acidiphilus (strain DSM 22704 / JCM 16185 / SJ4) TaxID=646529 RepID=I4D785_DESAJ|nr:hypothetical protein [Desulfosporosinus acidiphilus]AFM41659.1 hypothetical protein Desaci_2728 [Desulfosporosinus acidiphilus SJ4]
MPQQLSMDETLNLHEILSSKNVAITKSATNNQIQMDIKNAANVLNLL